MTDTKTRRYSPSQLELFGRCNRRWAFIHRAKRKEPFTGAAQAGTETHAVLENQGPWDKEWTAPDTGKVYPVGQMAALLQAQTPEGVVAREKRWEFEIEGLPFVCITDFLSEEVVGDYKTTSRIKNAKSKAKLLDDPQRLLNSAAVPSATKTTWLYGAWDTMLVTARECDIDREADKKRLHLKVLQPAEIMMNTPDDVDPLSMKPNVNDCALFPPIGCQFKSECFPPGKLAPVVRESKESNKQMASLIDSIRAKAAAKAAGEPAPEPAPAKAPTAPQKPEPDYKAAAQHLADIAAAEDAKDAEAYLLELSRPILEARPSDSPELTVLKQMARGELPLPAKPAPVASEPAPASAPSNYLVGTLYVDCVPLTKPFTNASLMIAASAEEAAGDLHVPHILLADYGKGGPALAAQLRANMSGQFYESLYLETRSAEGKACLNVLMSVSQNVIKGCF